MDKHLQVITDITALLAGANVSIPLIFGAVVAVSSIIKGITGTGPTVLQLADNMGAQLGANDAGIRAEIARLKTVIGGA